MGGQVVGRQVVGRWFLWNFMPTFQLAMTQIKLSFKLGQACKFLCILTNGYFTGLPIHILMYGSDGGISALFATKSLGHDDRGINL